MKHYNEDDLYETAVDHKTPVDYLEPLDEENNYREIAIKFTNVISLVIGYILSSKDPLCAAYGAAYAMGLSNILEGKSMIEVGKEIGVSSGTISSHAKAVRLLTGLTPSLLQMSTEEAKTYRKNRETFLSQ